MAYNTVMVYLTKPWSNWRCHVWQTKYTIAASIGIKRLSRSQALLIKFLSFISGAFRRKRPQITWTCCGFKR